MEKDVLIKDIYKVIDKIKKCKSKSKYMLLLEDLEVLYMICKELKIEDYPKLEDYSYKNYNVNYNKNICLMKKRMIDDKEYNLKFTQVLNDINLSKYVEDQNFIVTTYMNINDIKTLVNDFLFQYDKTLYSYYLKIINEQRLIMGENLFSEEIKEFGLTFASHSSFNPYILINLQNKIFDAATLVHELGHNYVELITLNQSSKVRQIRDINCFEEVYSYYLTFAFINYLKNMKIYSKDLENITNGYNYVLIDSLNDLKNLYYISENDILDIAEALNYSFGIALAYHFYDRSRQDLELTKKELNEFIINNGIYNYYDLLKKHNLRDELLDKKILQKYI